MQGGFSTDLSDRICMGRLQLATSAGQLHIHQGSCTKSKVPNHDMQIRPQLCPKSVKVMKWKALGPHREAGRAPSADQPGMVTRTRFRALLYE